MKYIKLFLLLLIPAFLFSCKSTSVVEEVPVEPAVVEPEVSEEIEEVVTEVFEEPEDEVLLVDEIVVDEEDKEYLRSTEELPEEEIVTKEEFEEDKAEILRIISELTEIMEDQDVKAWLQYISPDSITYYSTVANIRKAQKKLPDKTIQLHGIGDYFKYVFIPARKRSNVDEIRYISKTNVKAVQVKADNSTIVYYYFVKIDDKWLVEIPPLS